MTLAATGIEERFRALLLARSPEERLRMAARMFFGARELAQAGFTGPRDDGPALRHHIFSRFYGRDFARPQRERILAYLGSPR